MRQTLATIGVCLLVLTTVLSQTRTVRAQETQTQFCGTLTAYTKATETSAGSATVGSHRINLPADDLYSSHPGTQSRFVVGSNVCLSGDFDDVAPFGGYLVNPMPSTICGQVLAFVRPTNAGVGTVTIRDLGTNLLDIPIGTDVGPDPSRYACFTIAADVRGDAFVTGRELTISDRTAMRIAGICGVVSAWTEPPRDEGRASLTHQIAGSITVGSRTLAIAAGTVYSLVNAAPVVGKPTCLGGSLDADGTLIEYAAQPWMPGCVGGAVFEYRAPTSSVDGLLNLTPPQIDKPRDPRSYLYVIPAGTLLPSDADSGQYCFVLAIGPEGDAVVTGAQVPEQGRATGPSVPQLPSTSTR